MMSKTHIAVGVATSLFVTQPTTVTDCLISILGGTIGGIISDVDVQSNDYCKDAWYGRLLAILITALTLLVDWLIGGNIIKSIVDPRNRILVIFGTILLLICLIVGMAQNHRSFTHSFLALIIMSVAVYLIYPTLTKSFIVGFISHLLLDLMNKKKVQLFFPIGNGFCLGMCYADKTANFVFLLSGTVASIVLLGYFLITAVLR